MATKQIIETANEAVETGVLAWTTVDDLGDMLTSDVLDEIRRRGHRVEKTEGGYEVREGVTDEQIATLRREAAVAGDDRMVAVCERAQDGDAVARRECARVIAEAEAMV